MVAVTERLIRVQLLPLSGQNNPPTLTNTEFAMDRGCCLPSLLFNFLLPSGAVMLGTVKCSPMSPFTFDQKLSPNDMQQSIETRGFKALYMKKLSTKDKVLTEIAYRDGKGGLHLDLPLKWYKKVLPKMSDFDQCEENEELKLLFRQLEVVPLTTEQNTPEWFLL